MMFGCKEKKKKGKETKEMKRNEKRDYHIFHFHIEPVLFFSLHFNLKSNKI